MYNDPVKAGKGWLDKYYLYQIPTNEIALNQIWRQTIRDGNKLNRV